MCSRGSGGQIPRNVLIGNSLPCPLVASFKNLQVCNSRTELYSVNSKSAGAHGDPPWQTLRALRNSLRDRCGR